MGLRMVSSRLSMPVVAQLKNFVHELSRECRSSVCDYSGWGTMMQYNVTHKELRYLRSRGSWERLRLGLAG